MKTIDEFKTFYDTKYKVEIDKLLSNDDKARNSKNKKTRKKLYIALAILLVIISFTEPESTISLIAGFTVFLLIIVIIGSHLGSKQRNGNFVDRIRPAIYEPLLNFIDDRIVFRTIYRVEREIVAVGDYEKKNIHLQDIYDSNLFSYRVSDIKGQSFCAADIDGAKLEFSELVLIERTAYQDSDGEKRVRHRVVFEGLFFKLVCDYKTVKKYISENIENEDQQEVKLEQFCNNYILERLKKPKCGKHIEYDYSMSKNGTIYFKFDFDNKMLTYDNILMKEGEDYLSQYFAIVSQVVSIADELQYFIDNIEEQKLLLD